MKVRKQHVVWTLIAILILLISAVASYTFITWQIPKDKAPIVDSSKPNTSTKTPKLTVETIADNLDHPWEIVFSPNNTMYISERSGAISKVVGGAKTAIVKPDDVITRGEGGMMGIALHPQFEKTPYLYACFNSSRGPDIRVVRWKISGDAASDRTELITGMPVASSGRHSGCRIGFAADTNLWIGTGDAADSSNPQNLDSLGGKILRVDPFTGKGVGGNIVDGDNRIFSYGHRNVQGMAFYEVPQNGSYGISLEHGSSVDDEANALVPGNFGWAPGAGYNESVPMTDTARFPDAITSLWSSGNPTIATADADFVLGDNWGVWNELLAVGVLKNKHLRLLEIKDGKTIQELRVFEGEYGRLRAVTYNQYDGNLYISTDNGGSDKILKVTPSI